MLDALRQRTVAKVLFDEHHGEAWSIRPEAAARMRPSHPAAASYAAAAAELTARDFEVATTAGRPLDEVALAGADVLVIAHPSDPKWERTVGEDSPVFSPAEIAAVQDFVAARRRPRRPRRRRGGQVRRQPQRPARALRRAVREHDRVRLRPGRRRTRPGSSARRRRGPPTPASCTASREAGFYRAGALSTDDPGAVVLRTRATRRPARRRAGRGDAVQGGPRRGRRRLGPLRRRLPVAARQPPALAEPPVLGRRWPRSAPTRRPSSRRRRRTRRGCASRTRPTRCGFCRSPRARSTSAAHDAGEVRALVVTMAEAIADLAPRFPHQEEYLAQVVVDLHDWVEGGCGKPDFQDSLDLFRPELHRETASRTSSSSRCTRPTARRTRASRR